MKIDLSKSQIKELVLFLLSMINDNKFIIVRRDKNNMFMIKYRLDKDSVRDYILSKISVDNFIGEEFDNDTLRYGSEKVAIFYVECKLIDFHGNDNNVTVYVKIKEKKDNLVTISIHEKER